VILLEFRDRAEGPLSINTDTQSQTGWWSQSGMKRVWMTACRKVGVEINLYNGTKHSLGAALEKDGVDDRVLAEVFGHSDPKSVIPYSEDQTETARAALAHLPERN
jgi:hypothetical protein